MRTLAIIALLAVGGGALVVYSACMYWLDKVYDDYERERQRLHDEDEARWLMRVN